MADIHLYSMAVCPFAQRTRIVLEAKKVAYEHTEIDITKPRPDWFLELNPLGQVPVIRHKGKVLNESSVINEFLEDVFPSPPLFNEDPLKRAHERILIDYCNRSFVPAMYRLLMNQKAEEMAALTEEALATWRWLNDYLMRINPTGEFVWERFGMADLSFATFMQRYCLNDYYRDFSLPETSAYERVRRFRNVVLAQPLLKETGMSDEDYIKLYYDYSRGYGNGATPEGATHSSFDLSKPLAERPMPPRGFVP